MSHEKLGPDRFSCFDVYWIQTDRQTNKQRNKQTDKPNYIYRLLNSILLSGSGIPKHFITFYIFRYVMYVYNSINSEGGVAAPRVLECSQDFGVAPRVLE